MLSLLWLALGGTLFLAGLRALSAGLRRGAGPRMRRLLAAATKSRWRGFVAGVAATSLVQSSSAVNVTVVGFVRAGLLDLTQAVAVMIGANVGTTVTSQLLALDLQAWAPGFVALGVILYGAARAAPGPWGRRWRFGAGTFIGFGALMTGMDVMARSLAPVAGSSAAADVLAAAAQNHFGAVVAGALFTGVIQSSSMTAGVAMVLADSGLVPLPGAVGLVLGANVGTVVTTLLASVGAGIEARRAALADLVFNVAGVAAFALFLPAFAAAVAKSAPDGARQVANAHVLFNVVTAAAALPFVPGLTALVVRLVPGGSGRGPGQD